MNRSTTALLSSLPSMEMNQSSRAFRRVKNSSGSGGFVCETADPQTITKAKAAINVFFIYSIHAWPFLIGRRTNDLHKIGMRAHDAVNRNVLRNVELQPLDITIQRRHGCRYGRRLRSRRGW